LLSRLGVDVGKSWFEALGGRERLDFTPVELVPRGVGVIPHEATIDPLQGGYMQALKTLNPEFVMFFVARNRYTDARYSTWGEF
jgi:hypothetical protein